MWILATVASCCPLFIVYVYCQGGPLLYELYIAEHGIVRTTIR